MASQAAPSFHQQHPSSTSSSPPLSHSSHHGFVAVHVGAGHHSAKNKVKYLNACKSACLAGVELLRSDPTTTPTQVVERMISVLEDDPVTNAGYGSNLNLDCKVECDASLMNGTTLGFGSIGSVSDFKNPIQVAAKVLQESDQGPLSLGRIPPLMLVGPGVAQWIDTMGYQLDRVETNPNLTKILNYNPTVDAPGASLVSKTALEQHIHYNGLLQQSSPMEASSFAKRKMDTTEMDSNKRHANIGSPQGDMLNDTVGAICVDHLGRVAAGVSSGGIALKFPGRVSEAALFGAGCWAQDPTHEAAGFACSVTGAGEQITKTLLARTCMDQLIDDDDTTSAAQKVLDKFIVSPLLRSYTERHAGFVAIKIDPAEVSLSEAAQHRTIRGEFVYGHTTPTMGIGYMSVQDSKPKVVMSQRKEGSKTTLFTRAITI
ncbi:MAG: nucleophile aminohydrolase [Podila humilis]|nr:MAG: nucleophile aminohydrolase [Podila humilis]